MLIDVLVLYPNLRSSTKEYQLIKEEVSKVLSKGKAAGVLRLVFHDAGTFEMDDNTGWFVPEGHFSKQFSSLKLISSLMIIIPISCHCRWHERFYCI